MQRIVEIGSADWQLQDATSDYTRDLEAGRVLYFPQLPFSLLPEEQRLLTEQVLAPKVRNISLDQQGNLKGIQGDEALRNTAAGMIGRFRDHAVTLISALVPRYREAMRLAPTSYRPMSVMRRKQSRRANDRLLHVDAFPSRPNYGERILRVFANINPHGEERVWRLGESFPTVAEKMLPRSKSYSAWQASLLRRLGITKSRRSEYDHLMLQLHDNMKIDSVYQQQADEITMRFPPGSVWVCFSDQVSHGVLAGQYMLEQTLHVPVEQQYDPATSPLATLRRMTGRPLI